MIKEHVISNLPNPNFPIKKSNEPQSRNPNLPPLFFSALIIGSKNSGKSYAFTSLLKSFEENPIYDTDGVELDQRIILFSPTAKNESNIIFKNLKYLDDDDIYLEYDDDILENILSEIKHHIDDVNEYKKYKKALDKYENTNKELTDDEYYLLYRNEFAPMQEKKFVITHFVFDDLIGNNDVFNRKRGNNVIKFLLKHRHYYTNIIFTTQYINAIPSIIRNNTDVFALFKYASLNDVITKFYPCVSGILKIEEFKELYLHSTKEKFGFLSIVNHNKLNGNIRITKNWNINLSFE